MEVFFDSFSGIVLYLAILGILIACGFGIPISEDFLLIIVGFLIHSGELRPAPGLIVAYFGCLGGDFVLFNIGYHYGEAVMKHRFVLRIISHGRREKMLTYFRRYGDKFILFARFVAGLRAPTFLTSGISRMKPQRFLLLDATASLISVPLFVGLGYVFGDNLAGLKDNIHQIQKVVVVVVIAILALIIVARYLNLFRSEDKPSPH